MRTYTIPHCGGNGANWAEVPELTVDNYQWLPAPDIRMTAQICYDERAIYVHQRAWEKDIRAVHDEALSMVCEDSCMEFFLCPMEGDPRYFNFECNPNGRTYIGFATGRDEAVRLAPEEALFAKQARRCEGGWELFYEIPLTFLQLFFPDFRLAAGKKIRANCYKCGDLTVQPHYISWNPIDHPTPEFHRSCDFGLMILG